jgi:hypothetical protein
LNEIVREIVFLRDGHCVCPAPENGHHFILQPGHLISRGAKSVKWDLYNVNTQCKSCNLLHEHRPEIYTNWFIKKFEQERYDRLVKDSAPPRANEPKQLYLYEMGELYDELKLILEKIKENPEWKPRFTQEEILSGAWRAE